MKKTLITLALLTVACAQKPDGKLSKEDGKDLQLLNFQIQDIARKANEEAQKKINEQAAPLYAQAQEILARNCKRNGLEVATCDVNFEKLTVTPKKPAPSKP